LQLKQNRVSAREDIKEQTVHLVTPDVAYVVTRSTQTTQWRDGRVQILPMIETAVVARQAGRWRVLYKHLSWGAPSPVAK
jgi:ketosteroid isomerase-like protein